MLNKRILICCALICYTSAALAYYIPLTQRSDVAEFIEQFATKNKYDRKQLKQLFNGVEINTHILNNIKKPYEATSWQQYHKHFLTRSRIQGGVNFWHRHKKVILAAAQKYHVPESIIVSVLGVETKYGKTQGQHPVLNTLTTLAFDYAPRSKFFKYELAQYLLFCREFKLDPTKLTGSYAGAIGQPQFMPSSYRKFAVDFSGDGHIDLNHNTSDAIGSIANYMHQHGWHRNEAIIASVRIDRKKFPGLPKHKRDQFYTLRALQHKGVTCRDKHFSGKRMAQMIYLDGQASPWIGFHNFEVIKRYNPRNKYAMVVAQLAEQIEKAYAKKFPKQT